MPIKLWKYVWENGKILPKTREIINNDGTTEIKWFNSKGEEIPKPDTTEPERDIFD